MYKRIFAVINPASGKPEPVLSTLYNVLHEKDIRWDAAVLLRNNFSELIDRLRAFEPDLVAVYGGDGTISSIACETYKMDIPLAILPGGTANAMAVDLQVPLDLEQCCKVLLTGECREAKIDLGRINDRCFLTQVIAGYGSRSVEASDDSKSKFGTFAYMGKGISNLFGTENIRLRLTIDEQTMETEAFSCIVGNSGNIGLKHFKLSPVEMTDGLLDVFMVRDFNIRSLNAVVMDVLTKNAQQPLWHWRCRKVRLETLPAQPVQYDGETLEADAYEIQILPQALKVLVPTEQEN